MNFLFLWFDLVENSQFSQIALFNTVFMSFPTLHRTKYNTPHEQTLEFTRILSKAVAVSGSMCINPNRDYKRVSNSQSGIITIFAVELRK